MWNVLDNYWWNSFKPRKWNKLQANGLASLFATVSVGMAAYLPLQGSSLVTLERQTNRHTELPALWLSVVLPMKDLKMLTARASTILWRD
jgi:hypothetical protein